MMWVLLLVLAAVVLGLIGAVADGLLYLLFLGILVFLAALALAGVRFRRSGRHPTR
ncbi:hypothetical protein ACWGB8_27900 [Kitasatospora sp. NPDC054939]